MTSFDGFVAIDWSGAKGRGYDGIAVAMCEPGKAAPRLVRAEHRWTRSDVVDWLDAEIASKKRLLIGLDFAFAWPIDARGYFRLDGTSSWSALDLWDAIETASGEEEDFGCQAAVAHERFAHLFWTVKDKKMPEGWRAGIRHAETACTDKTGARPESVFKLIGPKQVGKASLTGMRVLRHLTIANRNAVSVWPFEPLADSVLVEIFPTVFRKSATRRLDKIRDLALLNHALSHFGAHPYTDGEAATSDHNTDALLSAAALRYVVAHEPEPLGDPVDAHVRHEGWIFGVKMRAA